MKIFFELFENFQSIIRILTLSSFLKFDTRLWEKTVPSNTSISNLENFNLENESGELKVSRELKDGMTQYQLGN